MPSATVHSRFVATSTRLVNRHGRNASLVATTDSGDAWNPTQAETVTPVVVVQRQFSAQEIDGELVRSSDRLYLMDASVEPTNDMRIRDDADYSIVNVDVVKPGTTSIIYKVQARR